MAEAKKKFECAEVFMYKDQPYEVGAEIELTEREAEFLLAQGKIKVLAAKAVKQAPAAGGDK